MCQHDMLSASFLRKKQCHSWFISKFHSTIFELFLFPGLIFPALIGFVMVLSSIFWAMVDVWPNNQFSWELASFQGPLKELFLSVLTTLILILLITKLLPKTTIWNSLILSNSVGGLTSTDNKKNPLKPSIGKIGKSVSELYPVGLVEIEGIRYEATSKLGKIPKDASIEVVGISDYELIVSKTK